MQRIEFFLCTGHDSLSFLPHKLYEVMLLPLTIKKGHWGDLEEPSLFCMCERSLLVLETGGVLETLSINV